MDKSNLKLFLIIFLLFGVLTLAVNLKKELDNFNNEYNNLTKNIYQLEYNWHLHLAKIKNSMIYTNYNNDNIITKIKDNLEYLDKFPQNDNYPKVNELLSEYKKEYLNVEALTYKFMRSNAKVKNSFLNLERKIKSIDRFDKEYREKLLKIISDFIILKGNFNEESMISQSLYSYFSNYNQNHLPLYKLTYLHVKLLNDEIPLLQKVFNEIANSKLEELKKEMLKTIEKESHFIRDEIQLKFYIILIAYILSLLTIIYFIDKSKRDNENIIKLQIEKEKNLLVDDLTSLLNRTSYLIDSKNSNSIILIDIIDFNKINSMIGYEGGDYILKELSNFLSFKFEKVYRVGVDHFAILFKDKSLDDLVSISSNILFDLDNHIFSYKGIDIPVNTNIGISNKKSYLKNAEIAISKTKESFKRISVYDQNMNEKDEVQKNFKMLIKVKYSIENDFIKPYFQPIVDLKTKEIIKYEALVRLIDEDKVISPYFFLDIAKKSKLYPEITKIVLKKSISFIKKEKVSVSINLSYQDIIDPNTLNYIFLVLQNNEEISHLITFEILESDEIDNYEHIYEFIKRVKEYGCNLAIDDFGSGYSNFTQLFKMKPDIVKIDGSLIKDIHTNENSRNIVESIVSLTSKSNIKTVAEFVDNDEVDKLITKLGIDYGQGYFYSPPQDLL